MIELVLPWPDRRLHPNSRTHWRALAACKATARRDAAVLTIAAGWKAWTLPDGRLHLWIDFDPPDKRKRDDDGLLSSMKAARDGIADALGIDDNRFVSHPYVHEKPHKGGRVRVRITGGPDGA